MDAVLSKLFELSTMDTEVAKRFKLSKLENFNEIAHLCFQACHSMPYEEKCEALNELVKDGFLKKMLKRPKEEILELGDKLNEAFEAFKKYEPEAKLPFVMDDDVYDDDSHILSFSVMEMPQKLLEDGVFKEKLGEAFEELKGICAGGCMSSFRLEEEED